MSDEAQQSSLIRYLANSPLFEGRREFLRKEGRILRIGQVFRAAQQLLLASDRMIYIQPINR